MPEPEHRNNIEQDHPLVLQRPASNPYRQSAGMLLSRLKWDLQLESWRSRAKIKSLKNSMVGKSAVILCNGPSLNQVDFSLLENTFTFGLNKINLLFDRTEFRPSCIVAVNDLVINQNADFFNSTDIPLFIDSLGLNPIHPRQNVSFIPASQMRSFSKDCSMNVYQGHTVTYVAMQLAFHMGFKKVGLVGCDHNFFQKGPSNKAIVADGEDRSHFDPTYFSNGVEWHLPDIFESEVSYTMAYKMYSAYGREIINCTEGGKLEIFRREALQTFLSLKTL